MGHHIGIGQPTDPVQGDLARGHLVGQVDDGCRLGTAETARPQHRLRCGQYPFGRHLTSECFHEPAVDGASGLACQLLVDDVAGQVAEAPIYRNPTAGRGRSVAVDQAGHHRVDFGQGGQCGGVGWGGHGLDDARPAPRP